MGTAAKTKAKATEVAAKAKAKANGSNDSCWKFDKRSTALQVVADVNLTGKYAIVTGANTGIGFETARALACAGCYVVIACRNLPKAQIAVERIVSEFPHARCEAMVLDLASFNSVRQFAEEYDRRRYALHFLILNAGVWMGRYALTEDKFETTYQTNHLSHFYLTQLLMKKLVAAAPSRIVVVSSQALEYTAQRSFNAHLLNEAFFVSSPANYCASKHYGISKTMNAVFVQELHRRVHKTGVSVFFLHPGIIRTELTRNSAYARLLFFVTRVAQKSREQGAATTVFCTCWRDLEQFSGVYFFDCRPRALKKWLQNEHLGRHLWELTEELIASRLKLKNI